MRKKHEKRFIFEELNEELKERVKSKFGGEYYKYRTFVMREEYLKAISEIENPAKRLKLIMVLLKYGFTGVTDAEDEDSKKLITIAKPLIDRSHENYIRSIAEDLIDDDAGNLAEEVMSKSEGTCDFREAKLIAKDILKYCGNKNREKVWEIFGEVYSRCKYKHQTGEIKRFWDYLRANFKEELKNQTKFLTNRENYDYQAKIEE